MKKLILSSLILLVSMSVQAIWLDECRNMASSRSAVSFLYVRCVNDNFKTIQSAISTDLQFETCSHEGSRVDPNFEDCINDNFSKVRLHVRRAYLNYCFNMDFFRLDRDFQDCVNSNNEQLERYL